MGMGAVERLIMGVRVSGVGVVEAEADESAVGKTAGLDADVVRFSATGIWLAWLFSTVCWVTSEEKAV